MHISASIFSNKNKSIDTLIKDLELFEVDALHIDCNNDPEVFKTLQEIRKITQLPFDIHLITDQPAAYYDLIKEAKPAMCCFQLESLQSTLSFEAIDAIQKGMAISMSSDPALLAPYASNIQYVLVMTTTPGQSGGVFPAEAFQYIRKIQQLYPHLKIQVDGGVNHEVSFILRLMGVEGIVSGSFLVNHDHVGLAYMQLTSKQIPSHFQVRDFMIPIEELPVVEMKHATVQTILEANEAYRMGCCLLVDENKTLIGLSTNADIRKGLLKHHLNITEAYISDFMNIHPLTVQANHTIKKMLEIIKSVSFPILLLPVVDENRTLRGIVLFNKLIKGE